MREIRFRAWDKRTKNWFETELPFVGFALFGECTLLCPPKVSDLEHLEISQFTGLKDKNRKEIYEGDVIKFDHFSHLCVCVWGIYGWAWRVNTPKGTRDYESGVSQFRQDEYDTDMRLTNAKVIGNIYECPQEDFCDDGEEHKFFEGHCIKCGKE